MLDYQYFTIWSREIFLAFFLGVTYNNPINAVLKEQRHEESSSRYSNTTKRTTLAVGEGAGLEGACLNKGGADVEILGYGEFELGGCAVAFAVYGNVVENIAVVGFEGDGAGVAVVRNMTAVDGVVTAASAGYGDVVIPEIVVPVIVPVGVADVAGLAAFIADPYETLVCGNKGEFVEGAGGAVIELVFPVVFRINHHAAVIVDTVGAAVAVTVEAVAVEAVAILAGIDVFEGLLGVDYGITLAAFAVNVAVLVNAVNPVGGFLAGAAIERHGIVAEILVVAVVIIVQEISEGFVKLNRSDDVARCCRSPDCKREHHEQCQCEGEKFFHELFLPFSKEIFLQLQYSTHNSWNC